MCINKYSCIEYGGYIYEEMCVDKYYCSNMNLFANDSTNKCSTKCPGDMIENHSNFTCITSSEECPYGT